MIAGQAPVTLRVDAAWICISSGSNKVNKPATVDTTIRDTSPSAKRIPLKLAAPTKRVKTTWMVYLLWHLIPTLLTGKRLPWKAWATLEQPAKILLILEA